MRLSYERYEMIKSTIAEFMEDYDVDDLPIDLPLILDKMKIIVKKASDCVRNGKSIFLLNGVSYYSKEKNKHIIYLNDVDAGYNRQRFSLAHEIMHIILGHTEQNEETEYGADFGAAYLLAPHCLALMDPRIIDCYDWEYFMMFGISPEITSMRARKMFENRLYVYDKQPIKDYESVINGLLGDSFREWMNRSKENQAALTKSIIGSKLETMPV